MLERYVPPSTSRSMIGPPLTADVDRRRLEASRLLPLPDKAQLGQFMTPATITEFMTSLFSPLNGSEIRLLDPGAGVGSLTVAFVQRTCHEPAPPKRLSVTAYEVDPNLAASLRTTLEECTHLASAHGIDLTYELLPFDFIEHATEALSGGLFGKPLSFTHVIANPPYKKINSQSAHRLLLRNVGIEVTNLYAAFVALSVQLLAPAGELVAITPRSFCYGPYFLPFRKLLLANMAIHHIHTFGARDAAFKDDEVLQENIIFSAVKAPQQGNVRLSSSHALALDCIESRSVLFSEVVHPNDPNQIIHIPTTLEDTEIVRKVKMLAHSLRDLGITVSTGPVVDFRLKARIHQTQEPASVPLIYPAHVQDGYVVWPRTNGRKPNAIDDDIETRKWLMPQGYYTLTRRFSSKEERRRIFAAVYDPARITTDRVGFENHLNVFHQQGKGLPPLLARGLALYLNSTLVDQYFRLFNGHTQVNASDLRALPYPGRAELIALGERASADKLPPQEIVDEWVNQIIFSALVPLPQHVE